MSRKAKQASSCAWLCYSAGMVSARSNLDRFAEDHWLYDWGAFEAKLRGAAKP